MLQFRLPNGEIVPVPPQIQAGEPEEIQGFYDGQADRVAQEEGISVEELHDKDFIPKGVSQ